MKEFKNRLLLNKYLFKQVHVHVLKCNNANVWLKLRIFHDKIGFQYRLKEGNKNANANDTIFYSIWY